MICQERRNCVKLCCPTINRLPRWSCSPWVIINLRHQISQLLLSNFYQPVFVRVRYVSLRQKTLAWAEAKKWLPSLFYSVSHTFSSPSYYQWLSARRLSSSAPARDAAEQPTRSERSENTVGPSVVFPADSKNGDWTGWRRYKMWWSFKTGKKGHRKLWIPNEVTQLSQPARAQAML